MRLGGMFSRLGKGTRSFTSRHWDRLQLQMESLEERVVLSGTTDDVFGCDEITDQFGNKMAVLSVLPPPVGSPQHGGPCGCSACAAMLAEMAATASATGASWTSAGAWSSFDASQVFRLHSNPGANHTIYLDFDGHITTETPWNSSYGSSIVTEAYDIDGNPSTFSLTELQNIYNIWRRVAEDFAPFNVNVTTQEPNIEMLRRTGSTDTQWGVRVVIGGNGSWFGSAGGVAYISSFSWNTDTPAFVFSRNLSSEKSVAEAITHEVGHTLGLRHHGTSTSAYYGGHGSGETGWAPIMGVGYHRNLTQWSRGDYPGANNSGQDDLAIITSSSNGFGYRADDVGDTLSTAAPFTVTGNTVFASGIIERNTDVDVFFFETGAGTITITANPAPIGPNLDIQLELLDAQGNVIATANPPDSLSASITMTVSAGRYYVRIQGVGKDTFSTGGYSNYGSLGQYSISGTIISPTSPPVSPPPVSPPPVSPPPVSPPPVVVSPPPVSPPPVSPPPVVVSPPPVSPPPVSPPPVSPPPVSVVVVDSGSAGFSAGAGWSTWWSSVYYGGSTSAFWGVATSTANFTATLGAGTYRISATWFGHANRPTNAVYTVVDEGGVVLASRVINQEQSPGDRVVDGVGWGDIGTVRLAVGGRVTVRLGGGQAGEYLDADAIRFERIGPEAVATSLPIAPDSPPTIVPSVTSANTSTDNPTWLPGRDTQMVQQTAERLTQSLTQFREKLRFLTEDGDSGWRDTLAKLRSSLSLRL
ncbi:MAG: pre-peptidase C-terminal domain-containing protein [Gemmataceae bacterium]|nr:pre-peptidase C-terminal domain-containing protein [Gemmata sp.]MDW8197379.1 pre-peptidase C-terminal domain-containing protein [Gemmataceae bacterium]